MLQSSATQSKPKKLRLPLHTNAKLRGRHNISSNPFILRPLGKWLDVVIQQHKGKKHFELIYDEKPTRTVEISQCFASTSTILTEETYQACRPWENDRKSPLVVLIDSVFFILSNASPADADASSRALENRNASYSSGLE